MSTRARLAVVVLSLFLAACASRLPPALRAPHPVAGAVVLLRPAVALGPDVPPEEAARLGELLSRELASGLSASGLSLAGVPEETLRPGRERLVRAAPGLFAAGPERARGRQAAPPGALTAARSAGGRVVVLPLLVRRGALPDEKGFLPRPDDELVEVSDQRRSWVAETISRRDPAGSGLVLRLLVVDAGTGKVRDLREVAEPVTDPSRWPETVVSLARIAARGLVPAGGGAAR